MGKMSRSWPGLGHMINYHERDRRDSPGEDRRRWWQLVNVGFFSYGWPRLILACRMLGHRPVVDGTRALSRAAGAGKGYRWVVCDRCGVRCDPQGSLDPDLYAIGERYRGPWGYGIPEQPKAQREYLELLKGCTPPGALPQFYPPGPVDPRPDGKIGGTLVIGSQYPKAFGAQFEVGGRDSEHTLELTLMCGPLLLLSLHTEKYGIRLQRKLNPHAYGSRVTGFRIGARIEWKIWSGRDSGSRYGRDREPWWRNGEIDLRLHNKVLGPFRYRYHHAGEPVFRIVRMPEGDYLVKLQLERVIAGRDRWRKTRSWSVDWNAAGKGIPTKGPLRGRDYGSGVEVSGRAVAGGTWPAEAAAAIALASAKSRTRYRWEPTGLVPVDPVAADRQLEQEERCRKAGTRAATPSRLRNLMWWWWL